MSQHNTVLATQHVISGNHYEYTPVHAVSVYDISVKHLHAKTLNMDEINSRLNYLPEKEVILKDRGVYYTVSSIQINTQAYNDGVICVRVKIFTRPYTTKKLCLSMVSSHEATLYGLTDGARTILSTLAE